MVLAGKLESEIEIKAPADQFHEVFGFRPHHVKHASPHHIQGCEVHEGEFGREGSIICWNYVHDGVPKVAKEIVEAIDDVNLSTTFKVIEGDLLTEYKNFRIIVKAIPKENGSLARWTLEYEKLNKDIPDPCSLLQFVLDVSRNIDAHLTDPK